jgi:enoyl-[acyl-carrier protein] reductase II
VKTRLCIDYGMLVPFVGAPLGPLSGPALAAAVSEAGGMGSLGAVGRSVTAPAELRWMIHQTRALTGRPFSVNFITPLTTDEHIDVCATERVSVVSFHLGEPAQRWVELLHAAGIKVWVQVGSSAAARTAVAAGADAVIAQGSEAGGSNRSIASTMALVPAVVDAVSPIPVIAAGGIVDGRGMAAALALGAEAVWVGTRLVASVEANAHQEYKDRVIAADEGETAITTVFCGPERLRRPVRALRNRVVRTWHGREHALPQSGQISAPIGKTRLEGREMPVYRFSTVVPTEETQGDLEEMCLLAGEAAALIRDIKPAGEIVRQMVEEAGRVIGGRLWSVMVDIPLPTFGEPVSRQSLVHRR